MKISTHASDFTDNTSSKLGGIQGGFCWCLGSLSDSRPKPLVSTSYFNTSSLEALTFKKLPLSMDFPIPKGLDHLSF